MHVTNQLSYVFHVAQLHPFNARTCSINFFKLSTLYAGKRRFLIQKMPGRL
jgi:hypothetical protein